MNDQKFIITLLQMLAFFTFALLSIIRFIDDKFPFVYVISGVSFLLAIIVMLFTTRKKLSESKFLWKEKKIYRIRILEIFIGVFMLMGFLGFILLGYYHKISTNLSDALAIFAFGVALSNEYLSTQMSRIFHFNAMQKEAESSDKVA